MPALPLPFIVTCLLIILLLRFGKTHGLQRLYWPFYSFLLLCAVMSVVVGLRWSTDSLLLRYLQPLLAALLPSVTWYCFSVLRQHNQTGWWVHSLPSLLVFLALFFWRDGIDLILVLIHLAYGTALMALALKTPDQWVFSRFDDTRFLAKTAFWVGVALVVSAVVDTAVAFDFVWYQGQHAPQVLAVLHSLLILVIGGLIAWLGQATTMPPLPEESSLTPETSSKTDPTDNPEQAAEYQLIVQALDQLLRVQTLYCDPDLSLNRLARKLGTPARNVSAAVNSILNCNVSQLINAYRVECVTQQLDQSEQTITEIMGNCGFQTKSNFNREFRRLTGMNPSEWRKRALKTPFAISSALASPRTD
ncbi:AraC family transcriptional regulator [uncultured Thiothrix sp.]|uniref:helix-turn-helix domain-containing protein n=1 Tax=uncultured Thiothrix sp. TaxID=223185 RepID=UPI00261470D6|nr:AraC family transcriptional regulator [uncultured Thiothrix sp.]